MITVAVGLLKRFGGWLLAILSAAAALWLALRNARNVGTLEADLAAGMVDIERLKQERTEELKAAKDSAATEIGTVKGAIDVSSDVNRLDAGVASDRLRDEWSRD